MGCLKGESEVEKKAAEFECSKCGGLTNKKGHACKPVKIKASDKDGKKDKKSKKKKK